MEDGGNMATIELDFDVWKELTTLRISEEITYSDVIRDLLRKSRPSEETLVNTKTVKGGLYGRQERGSSKMHIYIPNGTEFRAKYKGKMYAGVVQQDVLVVNGNSYPTPSAAAHSITNTPHNGWIFWQCRLPGQNKWRTAQELRDDPDLWATE
jgi:predicted CopG family antitoxin